MLLWALVTNGQIGLNKRGYAQVTVYSRDSELLGWLKAEYGGTVARGPRTNHWQVECRKARELIKLLPAEQCSKRLQGQIESVLRAQVRKVGRQRRGW